MKIVISQKAEKQLKKLQKLDQLAVARKVRLLNSNPNNQNEEKLKGFKDAFRVRVGDYRIVYLKSKTEITIVLIGHRKEIYNFLNRLLK